MPDTETTCFNEAVNFDKRVIFIAVPKSGTTSVRTQLAQRGTPFIATPHLSILQVRDALYTYLLLRSLGANRSFPSQGVRSDADVRAAAKDIFESFFKFAAVRNPWDRAVSLYLRREGLVVSERISFETFCKHHLYASDTCHFPTLHRNQLDWLCDEDGRCLMDYTYRLEDFNAAIGEIAARTDGRVQLEMRRENVRRDTAAGDYRQYYSDETRKIVAARFEKDIDYFKYTF